MNTFIVKAMDSSNNSPMRMPPLSNDELVLLDQGFEVYHTDSPTPSRLAKMKRQLSLPRRKNRARRRLLTLPSLADDGYDSDEKATAVTVSFLVFIYITTVLLFTEALIFLVDYL